MVLLPILARSITLREQGYLRSLDDSSRKSSKCTHSARLDLQLIVDSSYSVGKSNFASMMRGIADGLISQFDIGEDKTRVALFIYNHNTNDVFGLEKYSDASSLKAAIKAVKYEAGATYTAKAMQEALLSYRKKMRDDSEIARVCMVFTDGVANDDKDLTAASKAWADQDVTVFAEGIGNQVPESGLYKIAGSMDRIETVANFESIGTKAKSLLVKVCKAIPSSSGGGSKDCGLAAAGSKVIKVFREKMNWNNARSFCRESKVFGVSGDLAVDDDSETHRILYSMGDEIWIGGSDRYSEGRWKWVTGKSIDVNDAKWAPGEPNNNDADGGQNCLQANWVEDQWDDVHCNEKKDFACEYRQPQYRSFVSNRFLEYNWNYKTDDAAELHCKANGGTLIQDVIKFSEWLETQYTGKQWIVRGGSPYIVEQKINDEGKLQWTLYAGGTPEKINQKNLKLPFACQFKTC